MFMSEPTLFTVLIAVLGCAASNLGMEVSASDADPLVTASNPGVSHNDAAWSKHGRHRLACWLMQTDPRLAVLLNETCPRFSRKKADRTQLDTVR